MPKLGRALIPAGLWCLCLALHVWAAPSHYLVDTAPPGLPQSSVISMIQTRDGYLWLGTVKGLARFDGNRYEVFNEWNTPGLGGNTVVHLFEDSQQNLWIGAGNNVSLLRGGHITTLEIPSGNAPLRSACEDRTGAVWLYLADGRLVRCRDGKVENVWTVSLPNSNTRKVISDSHGQIWIGTDTELSRLVSDLNTPLLELLLQVNAVPGGKMDYLLASPRGGFWQFAGGSIYRVPINGLQHASRLVESYPWGNARIMTAIEDRAGNLIVGVQNNRVFQFTPDGKFHRIDGLSQDTALSLCEDREGTLWIGTDGGGLNRIKLNPFTIAEPWRGYVVQSIAKDATNGLWFGFNGGGVIHWDRDKVQEFGAAEGLIGSGDNGAPNFSAVLVDRQQRVWVGTRDYGLYRFAGERLQLVNEPSLFGRNISTLFEDSQGNLWVGTDSGLARWDGKAWRWLTKQTGLSADRVTAIAEDHRGGLWIGTERSGLNQWRDGKITTFHETDGLPSENITSLYLDKDDVLWVGTGNGLGRMKAGQWTRFTTRNGLASDDISYIIEDDLEHLWVGSNLGLMRLTKKSLVSQSPGEPPTVVCRVYGAADGLPASECTQGSQPAACRLSDGRLWFPTIRGMAHVNPLDLQPNTNAPLVVIESILLDDQEQLTNRLAISQTHKLEIPARIQRLDISFTGLNLGAPDRARFRYWMENHEEKWNSPTERRTVSYSKLPPGNYQFHVKASNEDGFWSPTAITLEIVVLPPFWKTWWFQACVGVALIGTITGIVYFISTQKLQRQLALLRQQEALEKERARIARDLHDQLGANLTQVNLLGEMVGEDKNLPEEVASHAEQICKTARTTSDALDEIVWAANPSNDTLEGLVNYACKYAQEYLALADLRYRLEVPPVLPATNIAPDLRHNVFLAFKESVNNVVKHARATEAKIRLRLDDHKFTFEIEDNGRGPGEAATKTGRNGLRNMRKRMEDVGGSFEMTPGAERGTIVRLTAPITKR